MPVFWIGIMLMLLFAVQWRLLPVSGWDSWASMVLPAVTLGAFTTPLFMRIIRSSMLEVINLDYVRTARAKGLGEWAVSGRHGFRNAMLPVVTQVTINAVYLLGGSVLIETIFALPGVGSLLVEAIISRDLPVVQGITLLVGLLFIVSNLVTDLLYSVLDPRIRFA
jgi:peptide/nickel transport system permease protein